MLRVLILPLLKINRWNREKSRAETGYLGAENLLPPLMQAARLAAKTMDFPKTQTVPMFGAKPKARKANALHGPIKW
jgi:hypothetical protein